MSSEHPDQIISGLRGLLSHTYLYILIQYLMGWHNKYRMYVKDFLPPLDNKRILDIGCGCAEILKFMPLSSIYVGYDMNTGYINYARKKYGDRATFHNQRVSTMNLEDAGRFDIVLADGLLHHLSDKEAHDLFNIAHLALRDDGFLFTADPTIVPDQSWIDRLICTSDRGRHVRSPEAYEEIARGVFPRIDVHVIKNVSNRPQTGCFMKCYKSMRE